MANLNKKETETMQIKINLKTYNLGDLKALALEKLRDTQENYTKKEKNIFVVIFQVIKSQLDICGGKFTPISLEMKLSSNCSLVGLILHGIFGIEMRSRIVYY